jgi:hypothetical protein
MDFDSEAVRRSSRSIRNLDNYFKTMVDEIDNDYESVLRLEKHAREMEEQWFATIDKFIITWSKIKHSDLDNERKELLKDKILSIFKARDIEYEEGLFN